MILFFCHIFGARYFVCKTLLLLVCAAAAFVCLGDETPTERRITPIFRQAWSASTQVVLAQCQKKIIPFRHNAKIIILVIGLSIQHKYLVGSHGYACKMCLSRTIYVWRARAGAERGREGRGRHGERSSDAARGASVLLSKIKLLGTRLVVQV